MKITTKAYRKPQLIKFTDEEMSSIIFAGASAPAHPTPLNNGCNYLSHCGTGKPTNPGSPTP